MFYRESQNRNLTLFVIACFGFALWLGLSATQNGPGVSSDGAQYILTAQNIHSGHGFISFGDDPYRLWPPGYPLAIAGLMYLGIGAEQAARLIPIICYALSVFPLAYLVKATTKIKWAPFLACLIYLSFAPILWAATWAWTDMPHLFLAIFTVYLLVLYAHRGDNWTIGLAAVTTALAMLTRFLGGALFITGLIVVLGKNLSFATLNKEIATIGLKWRRFVSQLVLYGVVSLAPIVLWSLYRPRSFNPHLISPLRQLWAIIHTAFLDFSNPMPRVLAYLFIVALILIFVFMRDRTRYIKDNSIVLLYLIVYPVCLILSTVFETTEPISTRYVLPIYPFLIVAIVGLVFYAVQSRRTIAIVIGVLLALIGFQATGTLDTYHAARAEQNCASVDCWLRNSPVIAWIEENVPSNAVIYSNLPEVLQYDLDRVVYRVPHPSDPSEVDLFFTKLQDKSYIVCFDAPHITWLMSSEQIQEANQKYDKVEIVAEYPSFTIWGTY